MIERYGGAIEADLAWRGYDLARLWRSRRWRFLLNLIDHLPGWSYFAEAQADDDDLARAYLAAEDGEQRRAPRVSEWDPVRAELTNIYDALGIVAASVAALGGQKIDLPRRARPETAIDRQRRLERNRTHETIVSILLGR